jgi:SHS2 domain-containing protein
MAALKFKQLPHPSDVGIVAFGKDNKSLFENAAFGMFSLMADLSLVENRLNFEIKVSGDDLDSLLINWLNELIFFEDTKKVLLKEFKIKILTNTRLEATVFGEEIDRDKHLLYRPIKAATYNQLQISPDQVKIVFDV